jgi:hypothetical protein
LELGEGGTFSEDEFDVIWRDYTSWKREGGQTRHFGESGDHSGHLVGVELGERYMLDFREDGGVHVEDEELMDDGSAPRKGVKLLHEAVDHVCKDVGVSWY